MNRPSTEEMLFIRDFLTSTDFKRFCKTLFEYRSDTIGRLVTVPVKSPTHSQEVAYQQGILVGMDVFAKILSDVEAALAAAKRKELEVVKDGKTE